MFRSILRTLAMVTAVVFISAGSALAVGYERHYAQGIPAPKRITKVRVPTGQWGATPREATATRVPAALDHASALVRDLMSQFGLLDKKKAR